jgi:hypothetical protein
MTLDEAEAIGARIAEARSWRYDDGSIDLNVLGGLIAAALLEAAGEWQTMDSAPRDGRVILCALKYGDAFLMLPMQWRDGCWWDELDRGFLAAVTHWRHLPAPPDVPEPTP